MQGASCAARDGRNRAYAHLARTGTNFSGGTKCRIQHAEFEWLTSLLLANSDYIQIRQPVYTSHSAGRYAAKRFRKAQCPIIERLTNSIMMNGRNNGKKAMAVRIVAHAFEIVRFPLLCLQIVSEDVYIARNWTIVQFPLRYTLDSRPR